MKVVLDTNVVVSGVFFAGTPGRILSAWRDGQIQLVMSAFLLEEYLETGAELISRYGGSEFDAFAALLLVNAELIDAPEHLPQHVSRDLDDDKFLACALAARATVIVSGDDDLLAVSGWHGIEVLTPRAFVNKYLRDLEEES